METTTPKKLRYHNKSYTREQKLVATVWFHERLYTGMSYEQLRSNFNVRFKTTSPNLCTLRHWEKRLFGKGYLPDDRPSGKRKTALSRLIHVPYVKESFIRFPNLSNRGRAQMLGISAMTLQKILSDDMNQIDVNLLKSKKHTEITSTNTSEDSKIILSGSDSKTKINSEVKVSTNTSKDSKNILSGSDSKTKISSEVKVNTEDISESSEYILPEEIDFVDIDSIIKSEN